MFAKELQQAGHTRKFSIVDKGNGWEARDVQDDRVLKQIRYTDWHRVERAISMFAIQIDELESKAGRLFDEPVAQPDDGFDSAGPRRRAWRAAGRRGRPPIAFRSKRS